MNRQLGLTTGGAFYCIPLWRMREIHMFDRSIEKIEKGSLLGYIS